MPDDDRPREPGTGNGDDDLDWSSDVPAKPGPLGGAGGTLDGLGIPSSAGPVAVEQSPPAPEPAPPPADPAPAEAPAPIPATVPTMQAVPPLAGGISVHLFGRTDVGLVREHNED